MVINFSYLTEGDSFAGNITGGENVYTSWVPAFLEFLFGTVGNAIALFLLIRARHDHKWQSFYMLYCGLALTDFSGIAFVYPFVMKRYWSGFNWSIKDLPGLCDYMSFMWMLGLMSTGLIICAMSVDRFHTMFFTDVVNNPRVQDDNQITHSRKKYALILLLIWLFSAVIAFLPIAGVGHNGTFYPGSWCFLDFAQGKSNDEVSIRIISYIYSVVGLSVFALTAVLNIITIAAFLLHRSRFGNALFQARQVAGDNNFSILVFLCAVFILFSSLWMPLMVNILQHASLAVRGNDSTELLLVRLSLANSIVDPWVYIMSQKEVRRRIRCCKRDEDEAGEENENRPLLH